jgi:hypothetical protein
MLASPGSTINHIYKSQKNYRAFCENHFCILPDGKTIIGAKAENGQNLICEDITKNDGNAFSQISMHRGNIAAIFYNALSKSLFVADCKGVVIEYQENENNLSWTQTKNYGNLGIKDIISVDQIGDIMIFGGYGSYLIKAINTTNKKLLDGTVKTAICNIRSLKVCELPDNKIYLSVCGVNANYSGNQTDIYDASDLAKAFDYKFKENNDKNTHFQSTISSSENEQEIKKNKSQKTNSCECNSKVMIEKFITKMENYLEVFANTMFKHINKKMISPIGNKNLEISLLKK